MSDLRQHYEKEMTDMKAALASSSDSSIGSRASMDHIKTENHNYRLENRLLREKVESLEQQVEQNNRY